MEGNLRVLSRGRMGGVSPGLASTAVGGVSDPRDPMAGGNRTLVQSSSRVGFLPEALSGLGDVMEGRISLLMLDTMVLAIVGFYVWTHKVQGGG